MVWMGIYQSGFFNAGICEADRQKSLSVIFCSGSRMETVFIQGEKWKKGEDGRKQAVFRESSIRNQCAIIRI